MILVPSPPGDAGSNNGNPQLNVRVQSPTPTSSRSLSQQQFDGREIREDSEDDEHENGDKDKQVKEGAYLKSKLWWFGLLLIATGEGGECSVSSLSLQS